MADEEMGKVKDGSDSGSSSSSSSSDKKPDTGAPAAVDVPQKAAMVEKTLEMEVEDGSDEDEDDEPEDEDDEDAQLAADLAGDGGDDMAELVAAAGAEDDQDDEEMDDEEDGEEAEEDDAVGEEAEAAGDDGAAKESVAAEPKRRGKPKDLKAPKRPLLPYHQHGGAERLRLKETNPDLLRDMKATGKAIAESWEKVPQADKDKMQAVYDKEKAAYDVLMEAYKKTESWRIFTKVLADYKDVKNMKKLLKKQKAVTPARPKSGYMSFAATARGDIQTEVPGSSPGDIAKKIAEKWQTLSEKEQGVFQAAAKTAQVKWLEEMAVFKRTEQYRGNIDEQAALELKQGQRKLKDAYAQKIPKRPASTFSLWASASGIKGGFVEVNKQFQALPEDQQKPWHEKTEQNRAAFKEANDAFTVSKDGQQLDKLQFTLKKKVTLAAARKKFLVDAPKRVPGVQVLCVNADIAPGRVGKWAALSEADQKFWEEEHARLIAEYEKKLEKFHQTDSWKQFEKASSGKGFKKKGKAGKVARQSKGGDAKAKPKPSASKVLIPESMPQKPPKARNLWMKEQKGAGLKLAALSKQWDEMGAEGQKKYIEQENVASTLYTTELAAWSKSKDGKKHGRGLDAKKQKQKELKAREKFLTGADCPQPPSKPKSSQAIFVDENKIELQKLEPGVGVRELNKRASALWAGLAVDERSKYESKYKSLLDVYEVDLQAYKVSPAYKKFEKAAGLSKKRGGAKTKGARGGAKRRKKENKVNCAVSDPDNKVDDAYSDPGSSSSVSGLNSDDDFLG